LFNLETGIDRYVASCVSTAEKAERDRILYLMDAHPNAAPGWLALQIRGGKL
jgi:hypothetical protein